MQAIRAPAYLVLVMFIDIIGYWMRTACQYRKRLRMRTRAIRCETVINAVIWKRRQSKLLKSSIV